MAKLRLVLTDKCNFNCMFCHSDQVRSKHDSCLNASDYGFLVKTAKDIGIDHVVLTGGEPLSRADINDIIEELYKCGIHLKITTNGSLINKIEKPQYINGLNISLHSTDLISHKKITGQNFALPSIIENIERIKNYSNINKKINVVALKTLTISQQNLKTLLNFCVNYNSDLKIIELLDNQNSEFIEIGKIKEQLYSMGFKVTYEIGRNVYLSNTRTRVILQKCFCQFAKDKNKPGKLCHQQNDLFILPSGKISCCRLKTDFIDILQDIKNRNKDELQKKLSLALNILGEECPFEKKQ